MNPFAAINRMLRGDVGPTTAALESVRRLNVGLMRRRERQELPHLNREPARLIAEFANLSHAELLAHFRSRTSPKFFPGFADLETTARLYRENFPPETNRLLVEAARITRERCWPLLGFGNKCFGMEEIKWNRDPLSGFEWPLDYHADINMFRGDGSDARVLWELNRLSHLITLGRAYACSGDENYAREFLKQMRSWRRQNPVGRGANWSCAMEVALRAMNLLGAFSLFLPAPQIDEDALAELLMIFDQHGAHIRRNLEYSHLSTSNHYMCDVAGLLWIGLMLPELQEAAAWREFGLRELLNETDKQILPDGADFESSTGYHRLKLELLLYSFILCRENGIEIEEKYSAKLRGMADYTRAYLRPDGRAPLIGDLDSGQVFPLLRREGNDHAYIVAIADAVFGTPASGVQRTESEHAELSVRHAGGVRTEEVLWLLGERAVRDYESSSAAPLAQSQAFRDAGIYILRHEDLYLLFNASGCGLNGRGSHGHNDALSIEVAAGGGAFFVDPGSYVYTHDLRERHRFRSTAYHSTVEVDGAEQNKTDEQAPFVIGDEAHPRVLRWETDAESDFIAAEHSGYKRLKRPVTHRRSVRFDKRKRFWLIEDEFRGAGSHHFATRFHCAPDLSADVQAEGILRLYDKITGARMFVAPLTECGKLKLEPAFVSTDYGEKRASLIACWSRSTSVPVTTSWAIIPLRGDENDASVAELVVKLRAEAPRSQKS